MVCETQTPLFWIAQLVNGKPKPWKHFAVDGVMVNAYEILGKTKANKEVRENGIHDYLQFKGPIMMDSGGFQFMKKEELNVDPMKILKLYEESEPDFGVVLDHPLGAKLSYEEKKGRLFKTLENTRIMVTNHSTDSTELVPVVHGHKPDELGWFLQELDKISSFDHVGIGSLVPSVFNIKGVGGIANVVEIVDFVRKKLPNGRIHVFGVGSTITMHLMYYAGADSIDSSAWRTKAAYGAIQLPGIGDRYITSRKRRKKYRSLSEKEKEILTQCDCPVCKEEGIEELRRSFKARALHNAWVFQKEVEKARDLVKANEYEDYVQEVLMDSSFSNAFRVAWNCASGHD